MPLFVIFVFGAVVIGSGMMLSPAWPTRHPRIGLAGAFALALVVGGALFWAMLFGLSTLVIDYLLFVLVTLIFLGGTLSFGQMRAEERGEELADEDQGWPGWRDMLLFVLAAVVFFAPTLVLPVPLGTDAQGFGYLALTVRLSGSFTTLDPFHPEITYLYSPAFPLLAAYLSQQLGQGLHTVQFAMSAVLGLVAVLLAYDLGSELSGKRMGRSMAIVMLAGTGLLTAYLDSHFTSMLGLVFALAFVIYVLRYQRDGAWYDALAASLALGVVALTHPDTTIILGLGYVPWLVTMWFGQPRPTLVRWLVLLVGVPLVALIGISPWLATISPLLGADIVSPFERGGYWLVMIVYHGIWIVPVALVGAYLGLRQRSQAVIMAVGWLVLILDFSTLGISEFFFGWLPIFRYDYPFSIAWHGPIIPYTILGGIGLLWLWDRLGQRADNALHRFAPHILGVLITVGLLLIVFNDSVLALTKGRLSVYGAFASAADVRAMEWLKDNTPPDARVLNYPGTQFDNSHEGDWVPVISERNSIYYRWQPFFQNNEASIVEQNRLRAFWLDPSDPAHADLLANAEIDYVIVPQIITNPDAYDSMWRWNAPPLPWMIDMSSAVADAPYLERVFDWNGAQVYQLIGAEDDESQ